MSKRNSPEAEGFWLPKCGSVDAVSGVSKPFSVTQETCQGQCSKLTCELERIHTHTQANSEMMHVKKLPVFLCWIWSQKSNFMAYHIMVSEFLTNIQTQF